MKKIYMVKILIILVLSSLSYSSLYAQYISKPNFEGAYENITAWKTDKWPNMPPSIDGNVSDAAIEISKGSKITRNGDFNPVSVFINGVFIVKGNYLNNGWNGFTIEKDCTLEIEGDLVSSAGITVKLGGTLIVHGNLISTNSGITSHGDIIVVGNFSTTSTTTVHNKGNLIVGGDFAHSGGGFSINGNKKDLKVYILTDENPFFANGSVLENSELVGGLDDFLQDESNSELGRLVNDLIISVQAGHQWVGNKGNDTWDSAKNWTGNRVPTKASNVRIKVSTDNPVINFDNGLIEINNLTIEPGAVLTLKPGAKLTVNGDLEIKQEGGLVLDNQTGLDGLASLITHGSVTGEVKVNLTLPNNQWYYLASPMKDVDYSHFGALQENSKIYAYRKQWVQYSYSNPSSAPELQPLEGTLTMLNQALPNDETTIEYSGVINNEAVARKLTSKGYYLFGNPYPSFINWQDTNWERDRIYGTIWYRTRVNQEMGFITYNKDAPEYARAAMFPDNVDYGNEEELALIPPYQSVWVYSKTASLENSVTLSVTPKQRAHGLEGGMLKSSSGRARADVIRVVSQNGSSRDGAVIYFSEEATPNFDPGDSQKYFNSSVAIPEVYTRGAGQMLAINGLPPLEGEMDLPLSVRNRVEGSVFLKFDLSKFNDEDVVLLRDEYLDVEINLRKVKQYNYEPIGLGDDHDRFVLRFNPAGYEDVSTNIFDEKVEQESSQINIVGINGRAIVSISRELLAMGTGKIEVYSIGGIKLAETEARTNKTFLVLPEEKGVYIVVVSASGERKVKKLLR